MSKVLKRFDAAPQEGWTKLKNYFYHSSDRITASQVEKVLNFLEEVFPNDPSLRQLILQSSPRVLRKNVKTNLQPTVEFLKSLYGDDLFFEAVRRNPDLLLTTGMGYDADELNVIEVYFESDLKLTKRNMIKLKQSNPYLFKMPLHKIILAVEYLRKLMRSAELSDDKIKKVLTKIVTQHSTVLQLSIDNNLKPRIKFLKERLNLEDADVVKMIQSTAGAILSYSVDDNLTPTINYLAEILLEKDLRRTLVKHPDFLGLSLPYLQSKVAYFQSIDPPGTRQRRSAGLASRVFLGAPTAYSLSLQDNIIPKVDFLAGLWGVKSPSSYILHDDDTSDDAIQKIMSSDDYDFSSSSILSPMLREAPNLLTLSLEGNMRPTVYFYNRTGYVQVDENWRLLRSPSDVKAAPLLRGRYLATSLFNRLLPRWHYAMSVLSTSSFSNQTMKDSGGDEQTQTPSSPIVDIPIHVLALKTDEAFCEFLGLDAHAFGEFKRESIPRLKFSSQFDTWLKTGRPIEID